MASGLIQFAFVLASGIINTMPNEKQVEVNEVDEHQRLMGLMKTERRSKTGDSHSAAPNIKAPSDALLITAVCQLNDSILKLELYLGAQFHINGITQEVTKYHFAISHLYMECIREVEDIITQPSAPLTSTSSVPTSPPLVPHPVITRAGRRVKFRDILDV
ncbi:hypothetical protein ACJJTC_001458 [Scirpophaga incertulas]